MPAVEALLNPMKLLLQQQVDPLELHQQTAQAFVIGQRQCIARQA
jgi:hypothetical protein